MTHDPKQLAERLPALDRSVTACLDARCARNLCRYQLQLRSSKDQY